MNALDYFLSDKMQLACAGAAGGLVRWLTLQEKPREGLISVVVGSLCSLYLGPIGGPLLEPVIGKISEPTGALGVSGFLIGVGGMAVSGFVLDVWTLRRKQIQDATK